MAHVHKLIDFVSSVYIIYKDKVLLVNHKKLDMWLPIGGHIELDEDPEQALLREIKEECGLKVKIAGERPKIKNTKVKFLYSPAFINIHWFNKTHRHIALEFIAKAYSSKVRLNSDEHNQIRWFSKKELDDKKFGITEEIRFCSKEAIKRVQKFHD